MTAAVEQKALALDMHIHQGDDVSFLIRLSVGGRTVLDLATEAGGTTATSESAEFTEADEGSLLLAATLAEGTAIDTVVSATEVILSAPAASTSTSVPATVCTSYPLDLRNVDSSLAQIRRKASRTSPVLATLVLTYDTEDLPGEDGYMIIELAAAEAAGLPAGGVKRSFWDLQLVIGGKTRTFLKGEVIADAEVSQLVPA